MQRSGTRQYSGVAVHANGMYQRGGAGAGRGTRGAACWRRGPRRQVGVFPARAGVGARYGQCRTGVAQQHHGPCVAASRVARAARGLVGLGGPCAWAVHGGPWWSSCSRTPYCTPLLKQAELLAAALPAAPGRPRACRWLRSFWRRWAGARARDWAGTGRCAGCGRGVAGVGSGVARCPQEGVRRSGGWVWWFCFGRLQRTAVGPALRWRLAVCMRVVCGCGASPCCPSTITCHRICTPSHLPGADTDPANVDAPGSLPPRGSSLSHRAHALMNIHELYLKFSVNVAQLHRVSPTRSWRKRPPSAPP